MELTSRVVPVFILEWSSNVNSTINILHILPVRFTLLLSTFGAIYIMSQGKIYNKFKVLGSHIISDTWYFRLYVIRSWIRSLLGQRRQNIWIDCMLNLEDSKTVSSILLQSIYEVLKLIFLYPLCRRQWEPLTTADVTTADSTANVSTVDVSTAELLGLGYGFRYGLGLGLGLGLGVRVWVKVWVRVTFAVV